MNTSQSGLQLRQRGLAIAAGGLIVQLLAAITAAGTSGWTVLLLPVAAAAIATVLSYATVKDRTGLANVAAGLGVLMIAASAAGHHTGASALFALLGAVVGYFGNKQLAAGIRF